MTAGLGEQQAIEQLAHPQNAFAQLPQAEHQAHGDAVGLEVGVYGGCRCAAGLQPLAQALRRFVESVGGAQRVYHLHAQALHITDEGMKGLGIARGFAHAQPKLGGKAGRENLPCAVGNGVEQRLVPARCAEAVCCCVRRWRQQGYQPVELGFLQRRQPLRIKLAGQRQHEKFGRIDGFRAARQQLGAQALGKLAHQSGARRKAKIGQQGGDVHVVHQQSPPRLQPKLYVRLGLDRFQKKLNPPHRCRHRVALAAHPVQQVDQPQVPVRQLGVRVQRDQQAGQIGRRAIVFLHRRAAPR